VQGEDWRTGAILIFIMQIMQIMQRRLPITGTTSGNDDDVRMSSQTRCRGYTSVSRRRSVSSVTRQSSRQFRWNSTTFRSNNHGKHEERWANLVVSSAADFSRHFHHVSTSFYGGIVRSCLGLCAACRRCQGVADSL